MAKKTTRKAPAFQLYVDDFLAGTMSMTPAEVGIYMRLLCQQWNNGFITDRDTRVCGGTPEEIRYVLDEKFDCTDGKYTNARLESVRQKRKDFEEMASERGKKGAESRWNNASSNASSIKKHASGNASSIDKECLKHTSSNAKTMQEGMQKGMQKHGSPSPSPSPSPTTTPVKELLRNSFCSEPSESAPSPPTDEVLLEFQVVGSERPWSLTKSRVRKYRKLYPALDVKQVCLEAQQWLDDNPTRRKTSKGMPRFLTSWLKRESDRASTRQPPASHKPKVATPAELASWTPTGGER